ncbi:MAG: putative small rane protein [Planctomycetota bacterium]|nr:putative small rane protein [Planctomycetota bacterium]
MNWIRIGAISGALAVAFGAFGAHGLTPKPKVLNTMEATERQALERRLANFETAARYHMVHALAIVAVGLAPGVARWRTAAGWAFLLGTVAFSGSLYAIGVGGPKWLGMIVTPTGGVLFIVGWVLFAASARATET